MKNNTQSGPKAPKDPQEKRSGFYIMIDKILEATARLEAKPSQDIYLDEGRLATNAQFVGGVEDENILEFLKSWEGVHKIVHSIGVTVTASYDVGDIDFVFHNYGKIDRYGGGTQIKIPCTKDGSEVILKLEDYVWLEDDDVVGKMAFEFEKPGLTAKATVKIYLQDGYEVPEISVDPPVEFGSAQYNSMISKSLLNIGNNRRLKTAIDRARKGEDITIAYIGGSITQGAGAKPIHTECYAYRSYVKFKEMFGNDGGNNVYFVKAGVGGTPSELGMIRYDRDVLKDGKVKPDIVIIEFAVNDEGDETKGICFESLVLNILSAENKPAVVLLFSVFANDFNLQERLLPVGKLYDLPMVSLSDALVEQFRLTKEEGNIITKRQYFYDIFHPSNDGHVIMADCLTYLFVQTLKNSYDEEDIVLDKVPVIGNSFVDIHLIDKKDNACGAVIEQGSFKETDKDLQFVEMDVNPFGTPQFPYNWMHTPESGNESFCLIVNSRNLLLVFKDSGRMDFGKAEVYVDGKYVLTANPREVGWTHCNAAILYQEESSREHKIEIKMAADSQDKYFTILGFGYN
ncbi:MULTISPECIES: SGNH/GDSL hydrolase family protein [unclassified Clostridium]|uniref:SGNH/GDSL hydrolase family protein n=1 Tax=unclassified Clostridium TaxID=2614128 RepID=UPI00029743DF|nr:MULTISPECIES: SGNH/GDSL hydrolase family protein [unclassified Clostridium]EKQ56863.1 MAG: lysophospholipase L1-like esterase [Clostridium sp. Maddingley MBC34-26]